jgi:hypothetical protein
MSLLAIYILAQIIPKAIKSLSASPQLPLSTISSMTYIDLLVGESPQLSSSSVTDLYYPSIQQTIYRVVIECKFFFYFFVANVNVNKRETDAYMQWS